MSKYKQFSQEEFDAKRRNENSKKSIHDLLIRFRKFEHDLKDMAQQSRNLKDFYTDMSEEHSKRLSSLAKRHTRHLIPPQHNIKKNSKLLAEIYDTRGANKTIQTACNTSFPIKRYKVTICIMVL